MSYSIKGYDLLLKLFYKNGGSTLTALKKIPVIKWHEKNPCQGSKENNLEDAKKYILFECNLAKEKFNYFDVIG